MDVFPRVEKYRTLTYDGRPVIGFKGYEVVQDSGGLWVLCFTPGGHD